MSISFTQSIISRLKREMADIEKQSLEEKKKKDKAQAKVKQLQKDSKKSTLPSDLSSKLTRINKLNEEIAEINRKQGNLSKQLVNKNAELKQHLSNTQQQESK
jgi:predicted  nucleic acid-binding Zn-ribbon protein